MRAQERRLHRNRKAFSKRTRHAQHAQLRFAIEPITGLDLDRRNAAGTHHRHALRGCFKKLLKRGGTRLSHRVLNTAAGLCDLSVRRSAKTLLELGGARAGIDQMRVAIDQSGRDEPSAEIDDSASDLLERVRKLGAWAYPCNTLALRRNCRVLNEAVLIAHHGCDLAA